MNYYYTLFFVVYNFYFKIDSGIAYQTKGNRSSATVISITIFEMLNFLSLYRSPSTSVFWIALIILFVLNAMIFLVRDKYLEVLKRLHESPPNSISKSVSYLYIALTIVIFVITRYL